MKKLIAVIMMQVFDVVARAEHRIAKTANLTYNEVNVLVYYLFIPLSWTIIIDFKIGCFPIFSILFLLLWSCLYWKVRRDFSHFCDVVFRVSQMFLLRFQSIGWNYVTSSVIICVIVPILIYVLLLI